MKFALAQVHAILIDSETLIDSNSKAFLCIVQMYKIAYKDRAGKPLFHKEDSRTPNEERLMAALRGRFGVRGKNSLLIVTCGDCEFIFGRANDEYGSLLEVGHSEAASAATHHVCL